MAKRRKKYSRKRRSHRSRRHNPVVAFQKHHRKRRRHSKARYALTVSKPGTRRHPRPRRYSFRRVRRSNPLGGMIRIPTVAELGAVAIGGLAVPMVVTKVMDFIPVDALKTGYGNILTELVLGTAAAGATRKFLSPVAGDVVFYIVLARAVTRIAKQVAPGTFGTLSADGDLGYADLSADYGVGADDAGVSYADLSDGPDER